MWENLRPLPWARRPIVSVYPVGRLAFKDGVRRRWPVACKTAESRWQNQLVSSSTIYSKTGSSHVYFLQFRVDYRALGEASVRPARDREVCEELCGSICGDVECVHVREILFVSLTTKYKQCLRSVIQNHGVT